jgi:hypothetical protein
MSVLFAVSLEKIKSWNKNVISPSANTYQEEFLPEVKMYLWILYHPLAYEAVLFLFPKRSYLESALLLHYILKETLRCTAAAKLNFLKSRVRRLLNANLKNVVPYAIKYA